MKPKQGDRTVEDIKAELELLAESNASVAEKLAAARAEIEAEQKSYDAAIEQYAIGRRVDEPIRPEIGSLNLKIASLERLGPLGQQRLDALRLELAGAELLQTSSAGRDRFTALVSSADIHVSEFERALIAAKQAEAKIFDLLYRPQGLRGSFPEPLSVEAKKERFRIAGRVREMALRVGYAADPRFEIDGEVYLGEQPYVYFRGFPTHFKRAEFR